MLTWLQQLTDPNFRVAKFQRCAVISNSSPDTQLGLDLKDYAAAVAKGVLTSGQIAAEVRRAIQISCCPEDYAAKKGSLSVVAVKGMQHRLHPLVIRSR